MFEFTTYLNEELGLMITATTWKNASLLPIFLSKAADYALCNCQGIDFVAAIKSEQAALPELKRISKQVSRLSEMPVVIVSSHLDSRQRHALTKQGIAFIAPKKQACLPFLAFTAKSNFENRTFDTPLTPVAQAMLVTLISKPEISTAKELRETMGIPESSTSRGLSELAQKGIVVKKKSGREIIISYNAEKNSLLKTALPFLSTPVSKIFFAKACEATDGLPYAGESALAKISMLAEPSIAQKAASKKALSKLNLPEVIEGELPDSEIVEIQEWKYDPLITKSKSIDCVSLALSLAHEHDERISGELNDLFQEEDLWR